MKTAGSDLINRAYAAFNKRDIDAVLAAMHPDVHWSNGWEGGYVDGHEAVRAYWTRQWNELDPMVVPAGFREREDGKLEVTVRQTVRNLQGVLLSEGIVKHIYTIRGGLIARMDIEKP